MWLPLGFVRVGYPDHHVLRNGNPVVCCSNCVVHEPCQLFKDGVGMRCSWREAPVLRCPRATSYAHIDIYYDRVVRDNDSDVEEHPYACPLWCLPLHGFRFP